MEAACLLDNQSSMPYAVLWFAGCLLEVKLRMLIRPKTINFSDQHLWYLAFIHQPANGNNNCVV